MRTFSTDRSSNIKAVTYDDDKKTLLVEFKLGGKYVYEEVPVELYESFSKAESAGKFFFANVRNKYKFTKLDSKLFG